MRFFRKLIFKIWHVLFLKITGSEKFGTETTALVYKSMHNWELYMSWERTLFISNYIKDGQNRGLSASRYCRWTVFYSTMAGPTCQSQNARSPRSDRPLPDPTATIASHGHFAGTSLHFPEITSRFFGIIPNPNPRFSNHPHFPQSTPPDALAPPARYHLELP